MKSNELLRKILAISAFFVVFAIPTESQAVSMYARQTGQACASCHFQHYPLLNDYGRAFKAGGYTQIGKEGTVEGENLSIPETLNIGMVAKIRFQKTNGPAVTSVTGVHGMNDGRWDIPDELSVLIGGRINKNIGFFLEGATVEGPFLGGFKIPFTYDVGPVKVGVVPFSTGELGASFGFELLNTGAVKNQRMAEQGADISAQQYVVGPHAARGAAFVVSNPLFFVNLTKWSPGHVGEYQSSPEATYFRAAVTPRVGDWDLAAGVQSWSGSAEVLTNGIDPPVSVNDTKAMAVDAQAQGKIGAIPLGIYLSYAKANATSATGTINYFNVTPGNNERNAAAVAVEIGVLPRKATVILAYRKADNGELTYNGDNAVTVGGTYQIVQNMQLQLTHAMRSGSAYDAGSPNMSLPNGTGDRHTTLLLFGSF
jgi:hypothetical protein